MHFMYLKRKLRTCRIQIQVEKVWFSWKNQFFLFISNFSKGFCISKISFLIFWNFQKNFFWKMASMGPIKCWKEQSHEIWAQLGHPLRIHDGLSTCAGTKCPPSCSIGLRYCQRSKIIKYNWKKDIFRMCIEWSFEWIDKTKNKLCQGMGCWLSCRKLDISLCRQ